ncbi:MAG: PHP domain-containing protein [Verrucomicrobiota bacterium]
MVADLHLHTSFSDGTYSPEELAGHASAQSLAAVALTDHDSVEGCPRMAAACAAVGIEFIPGAELTAELEGKEFHVLGYWMDIQSPTLLERLAVFQAARRQRILEMVDRLNRRGVALRAEHVFELSNCSAPGRPHVARALVAAGCCSSYDDAFDRYLKKGRPGWVPKVAMPVEATIALIHAAGGVAVLAHPGLYRDDAMIPRLAAAGLDGIECWHTRHSVTSSESYARVAERLGLAATGGSDCHGMAKGEPLIGRIRLPYHRVTELKSRRPVTAAAA